MIENFTFHINSISIFPKKGSKKEELFTLKNFYLIKFHLQANINNMDKLKTFIKYRLIFLFFLLPLLTL
jgi:hypothetical protein